MPEPQEKPVFSETEANRSNNIRTHRKDDWAPQPKGNSRRTGGAQSHQVLQRQGGVPSGQGEAGGLGERPNESDTNNFIDVEPNTRNLRKKAVLLLCKGCCGPGVAAALHPHPIQGGVRGQGTEAGLPGWLKSCQ